ncbi:hypothetical protein DFQ30_001964, partial [Apophysomyces sp. BC1015]
AAALVLGASAVQIGTAFLRCPEAALNQAWADALHELEPEYTIPTRAFTGRLGRSVATRYALAMAAPDAPHPALYPVQRALTAPMKEAGGGNGARGASGRRGARILVGRAALPVTCAAEIGVPWRGSRSLADVLDFKQLGELLGHWRDTGPIIWRRFERWQAGAGC